MITNLMDNDTIDIDVSEKYYLSCELINKYTINVYLACKQNTFPYEQSVCLNNILSFENINDLTGYDEKDFKNYCLDKIFDNFFDMM